jgi:hypothetical protein
MGNGDTWLSFIESVAIWGQRALAKPVAKPARAEDSLGRILESDFDLCLDAKMLSTHAYILGSTGCGKTSLILRLLERDIREGHSVVVIDLRGDLVSGALMLCDALKVPESRVTLLDLREKRQVVGFNPLAGAGEPYIRALHLLDVVSGEAGSWGVQLDETLRCALLLLAYAEQPITMLEAVFYDTDFRSKCLSGCSDEALASFWERYEELGPERHQSWAQPVMNKVTPLLAVPSLRQVLSGKPGIALDQILNQPGQILLVSLAVDELHRSSRMVGSLLVSAIAREMMSRVNAPQSRRTPVRLYVDEFENMASERFESLVAEGRRFNLSLVLSHQTLSQLPGKLRSVIRNNVGLQIIFQCGCEDARVLARELPDQFDFSDIQGLAVGQAILLKRDGSAEAVQFDRPRMGRAPHLVAAYRQRVLARFPQPTAPILPARPSSPSAGKPDLGNWL